MPGAKIDCVIPFYGDQEQWSELAMRAMESAVGQPFESVNVQYGSTLAEARNDGAAQGDGEWIVFLDADDELAPGYAEGIRDELSRTDESYHCDAVTPRVQYLNDEWDTATMPDFIPRRDLSTGNYLIIGTAVRRHHFEGVGGFREWPIYEDWDLFLRVEKKYAKPGLVVARAQGSVYLAHQKIRDPGRNLQDEALRKRTRREIEQSVRSWRPWR